MVVQRTFVPESRTAHDAIEQKLLSVTPHVTGERPIVIEQFSARATRKRALRSLGQVRERVAFESDPLRESLVACFAGEAAPGGVRLAPVVRQVPFSSESLVARGTLVRFFVRVHELVHGQEGSAGERFSAERAQEAVFFRVRHFVVLEGYFFGERLAAYVAHDGVFLGFGAGADGLFAMCAAFLEFCN